MRWKSLITHSLLVIAGMLVLGLGLVAYLSFKDYGSYFRERRGALLRSRLDPAGGDSLSEQSWLTLESTSGLKVKCGLLVPREKGKRYPAIILLGGKTTGRHAVEYALNIKGVVIVAPDYPFEARESYTVLQFLKDVPAIRQGLIDMFPAVMAVREYLQMQDNIDTNRVVVLGYSFGAPFVPCVVAHDHRYAAAAIVYGGGDLHSLIRHNVRRYKGPLESECAGLLGATLLRPVEPLRYAAEISPTPLIMINGKEDEQIPERNVRMLYDAAREPKTLVWLESRHVNPSNVDLTRRIVGALRAELARVGVLEKNSITP